MGLTAGIVAAGIGAAAGVNQGLEARKARKSAEAQAAAEREALAALQQEPEPVMPVPDDKAMRDARRRSISSQMRRRGRASTLLSESGGDGLGG